MQDLRGRRSEQKVPEFSMPVGRHHNQIEIAASGTVCNAYRWFANFNERLYRGSEWYHEAPQSLIHRVLDPIDVERGIEVLHPVASGRRLNDVEQSDCRAALFRHRLHKRAGELALARKIRRKQNVIKA
jgi:hypothetical protein